jgi:hypothetical protein
MAAAVVAISRILNSGIAIEFEIKRVNCVNRLSEQQAKFDYYCRPYAFSGKIALNNIQRQ